MQPYTTTAIGSYSVPRWYEALEQQIEAGALTDADMQDAQVRATQAAVVDQETTGIDIITGGEMHRRTNNRHAPANAMLNHFWRRLPGFSQETRMTPIAADDPHVKHPCAVCTGPIGYADLGLVDEFRQVASFVRTSADVKITMTSPHMLAAVAIDEHYGDIGRMMQEVAKVLNRNFRDLEAAGCKYVQLDEPLFAATLPAQVDAAVDAFNIAFEGIGMHKSVHICQGNYRLDEAYHGAVGRRLFTGNYPAGQITRIECDAILVEYDFASAYEGLLGNKSLGVGAADVLDTDVETLDLIIERVGALAWLAPEQTLLCTTCGLVHLPRTVARGKLQALHSAQAQLRA